MVAKGSQPILRFWSRTKTDASKATISASTEQGWLAEGYVRGHHRILRPWVPLLHKFIKLHSCTSSCKRPSADSPCSEGSRKLLLQLHHCPSPERQSPKGVVIIKKHIGMTGGKALGRRDRTSCTSQNWRNSESEEEHLPTGNSLLAVARAIDPGQLRCLVISCARTDLF